MTQNINVFTFIYGYILLLFKSAWEKTMIVPKLRSRYVLLSSTYYVQYVLVAPAAQGTASFVSETTFQNLPLQIIPDIAAYLTPPLKYNTNIKKSVKHLNQRSIFLPHILLIKMLFIITNNHNDFFFQQIAFTQLAMMKHLLSRCRTPQKWSTFPRC